MSPRWPPAKAMGCHRASRSCVGQASQEQLEYLRVFMGQLRKKLEPDPSNPRYLVTDPGSGIGSIRKGRAKIAASPRRYRAGAGALGLLFPPSGEVGSGLARRRLIRHPLAVLT